MSTAVTQGVKVTVQPRWLEEHSAPAADRWVFAYTITISNGGDRTVQLVSRHWIITDAHGHEEEVRGAGVVGEQPVLEPGASHENTSFCPLPTPLGSMRGTFRMQYEDGDWFDAVIAPFTLVVPHLLN